MKKNIIVRYARKPINLAEVESIARDPNTEACETAIVDTMRFTQDEYDSFACNFLKDYAWLNGKGGIINRICQAVAVTAPERETLYVNPEGNSYGRYVGIEAMPKGTSVLSKMRLNKVSAPINQAMFSQLVIMEHFVHDILGNIEAAQERLEQGERNGAVGALIGCAEAFEHLRTFYDVILVMHRNAELVEREEE